MIVVTENSSYEFDLEQKRVRRLRGVNDPTPRLGTDGEWRTYVEVSDPQIGQSFVIRWPDGQPELRDHTISSAVILIASGDEIRD